MQKSFLMKNFFYNISKKLLIAMLYLSSLQAEAKMTIIYDSEVQNVIEKIVEPIFSAAKIKKPQIYVIADPTPNAFTTGGEIIYIHTGLIYKFPEPNILRGVVAHEAGHITARHVSRIQTYAEDQKKFAASSLILGLIGFSLTQNPNLLMQGALVGAHTSERSILKYSRENETIADIKAVEYLRKSGYNASGLISLLESFAKQDKTSLAINKYDLTHPISQERISLIKNQNMNSRNFEEDNSLKYQYQMIGAKLSSYTTSSIDKRIFNREAVTYAEAIIAMKRSDKKTALKKINNLINNKQSNPYFYQLKGEILAFFGDISALEQFKKALSLIKDPILKIENAIAEIKFLKDSGKIKIAIQAIESSSQNYMHNNVILDYLALGYDKIGQTGYSIYYRALGQKNNGNLKLAKKLAMQCKALSHANNVLALKCDDIINTEE